MQFQGKYQIQNSVKWRKTSFYFMLEVSTQANIILLYLGS